MADKDLKSRGTQSIQTLAGITQQPLSVNAYNSEVPAKYVRESGRESADRVQSTPGTREQFRYRWVARFLVGRETRCCDNIFRR
ncbi:hypothetical protein ARMGADRAFT_1016114 [Armillaria gallica]|uniref:Uncharacterized protein n=1 Tax=Armillaria gallica TaxID=47427 RepID=A0A2H3DLM2_ARMGA|nr:hypothetical protein ARMGADRAFT_1016114 [Armillaria gallica]